MSLWKTKALDAIRSAGHNPDTPTWTTIRSAKRVMALFVDLIFVFQDAHRNPRDEALIAAIYAYVNWCVTDAPRNDDAGHDPATAAAVGFYEHLPRDKRVRANIGRYMSRQEVADLSVFFKYFITDEDFAALLIEVDETSKRAAEERRRAARRAARGSRETPAATKAK